MPSLRDYTRIPFEILVATLTVLPFLALAFFYSSLPDRVPIFLKLNGEVSVWAEKGFLTVFRVPLMAVVTQVVCLLMKFGALQSKAVANNQMLKLHSGLWDWFRWTVAVKLSFASLDTIFLSIERFHFLARPAFIATAVATAVGIVGAIVYGYRLLMLRQASKEVEHTDPSHVHGGVFYYNSADPAMFSNKYVFNFANKWVWVFLACLVAYPLLVFLPG